MNTDLSVDDVKNLTFELYMAQRELGLLRERVAELESRLPAAQPTDTA